MLFKEEDIPGLEVISRQSNDKIVKEIEKHFESIINIYKENKDVFVEPMSFFLADSIKNHIEAIDKLIFKRFGIKTKHVCNSDNFGNYAVIPTLPIGWNKLNDQATTLAKTLAKTINEQMINKYNTKKPEDIQNFQEDSESIVYNIYKSIKEIDKQMKTSGVKIDLDKAQIKNLPKDYNIFILVNFYNLINILELSADELTGILLHEIGHAFTHLEYMYAATDNLTVLAETIKEEMSNKKDAKEVITIIHKKLVGKYPDPEKNEIQIITDAFDYSVNPERVLDKHNLHLSIDSEQQADQFTSRFGYGLPLITALKKFNDKGYKLELNAVGDFLLETMIVSITVSIIYFLLTFEIFMLLLPIIALGGAIGLVILGYIFNILLTPVFNFIGSFLRVIFTGTTETEATYDEMKRRMERIVNDQIRQIRLSEMSLKEKKQLVNDIESSIKLIDTVKPTSSSVMKKIVSIITPNFDNEIQSRQSIGELIEDLKENRLHLAAAKLETIGTEEKETEWPPVEPKNFFDELKAKYK